VVKRGRKFRFALKTFKIAFAPFQFGREDFDGDQPVELGVESFVNRSLPARAENFEKFKVVERIADVHLFAVFKIEFLNGEITFFARVSQLEISER
jgi:hypothetical protein